MLIPGLDGRKMSKSYGNEIPLFTAENQLKKLVMSIKTDSTPLEEPKMLSGSLLGDLFKVFADTATYDDLEGRLAKGGLGWGHAKAELFEVINQELKEPRARYFELRKDESSLIRLLKDGAQRAIEIGQPVLNRVREAIGFPSRSYKPA